jgi:hypothetical protein
MPRVHPAKAKNARASKHVSTLFHSHRDETNAYPDVNMANPVCFFDIEIGGQPAGRIEMTVRAIPWMMTTIPDGSVDRISRSDCSTSDYNLAANASATLPTTI